MEDRDEDDEDNQEPNNEKEEEETEDPNPGRVKFDMSHLTREEQEEEAATIEADPAIELPTEEGLAQYIRNESASGIEPPEDPKKKEPELLIRQPRRSPRDRTKVQPSW